ncbi:MAG TPA: hypothetical protein VFE78_23730 [Gemmataceae bacterium]|jgi:hypothetical protein|nr:hypothetical protein [Gemmataceae bacterium]
MLTLRDCCLTAAALLAGWPCLGPPARAADARHFPDDTELVVAVNVRQVLGSEPVRREKEALDHVKSLLDRFVSEHPAMKCLKEAGVDVSHDLSRITFAGPRGKGLKAGFLILEGDFSARRLDAALAGVARGSTEKLKVTRSGAAMLYEITAPSGGRYYATLVNTSALVVGTTRAAATDALARANGLKKSGLSKELTALLGTATGEPSIHFAATGPALAHLLEGAAVPNASAAVAALKAIDGLSGAVTLAAPVRFQLGIFARDDETAKRLAGAGNSAALNLLALVRQQARKDDRLLPVVEVVQSLRVTTAGPTILLRSEASLDAVEKLMSGLPLGRPGVGRAAPGR